MKLKDFCENINCKYYNANDGDLYICTIINSRGFLELTSYITPDETEVPADSDIVRNIKEKCLHYNVIKQIVAVEKL
jgi:hypothetical protein